MRVIIIEDELPAAKRLAKLIKNNNDEIDIVKHIDSVEASIRFLEKTENDIDLIFMDIQLADGISFEIFQQTKVKAPVIFTTAYDQYSIKAFKVNSIDYLLKPIDENELDQAIKKYQGLYASKKTFTTTANIAEMIREISGNHYKERLLVKRGQQLNYLKTESLAYCFADGKLCYAVDFDGNKSLLENNLSQLEEQLRPNHFFRINRHLMVNINSIKKVHTWFGGRLKLEINPTTSTETIVSRERVSDFKEWLGK